MQHKYLKLTQENLERHLAVSEYMLVTTRTKPLTAQTYGVCKYGVMVVVGVHRFEDLDELCSIFWISEGFDGKDEMMGELKRIYGDAKEYFVNVLVTTYHYMEQ